MEMSRISVHDVLTLSHLIVLYSQLPKPKPPTRWEAYAKLKGIQNRKKERMVWDKTHNVSSELCFDTDY